MSLSSAIASQLCNFASWSPGCCFSSLLRLQITTPEPTAASAMLRDQGQIISAKPQGILRVQSMPPHVRMTQLHKRCAAAVFPMRWKTQKGGQWNVRLFQRTMYVPAQRFGAHWAMILRPPMPSPSINRSVYIPISQPWARPWQINKRLF